MTPYVTVSQASEILDHLDNNQVISAIKVVRMATRLGLKESKDIIDDVRAMKVSRNDMHRVLNDALTSRGFSVVDDWAAEVLANTPTITVNGDGSNTTDRILLHILAVLKEQNELLKDIKFTVED